MTPVEALALPLLVLHALLGLATVGAATHLAVYAWLAGRGAGLTGPRSRFARLVPVLLVGQLCLGLLLYPTYRVRVRAAHFDAEAPWLAQLFDLKEHLAALSLPLLLGAALLSRRPREQGPESRRAAAALAAGGALLVWLVALLGLWVTAQRSLVQR